jgi:hypothetical protein
MLADALGPVGAEPYLAASGHLVIGTRMVGQDAAGAPLFDRRSADHHPDCHCLTSPATPPLNPSIAVFDEEPPPEEDR